MRAWKRSIAAAALAIACAGCGNEAGESAAPRDAANSSDAANDALLGRTWGWVSTVTPVERVDSSNPQNYTITLEADGTVLAQFDCNRGRGSYELADYRLSFGVFAATRMACPENSQDSRFARDLERIATFFIDDGELYLEMPMDSGTMRFRELASQN